MDLDKLLTKESTIRSSYLKELLFEAGIKENKCEICGITEWQNAPIKCHLHHKDGDKRNNTLENLQILCPNCHSQTDSYCSSLKHCKIAYCKRCGKRLKGNTQYCADCYHFARRKVERPTLEMLKEDFKKLHTFTSVGKKYGVSDTSIRKWCKGYDWYPTK